MLADLQLHNKCYQKHTITTAEISQCQNCKYWYMQVTRRAILSTYRCMRSNILTMTSNSKCNM